MSVKITENRNFNREILKGFQGAVREFERQARDEIESSKWQHPRETTRSTGQTVSSPRNIVDTGKLRDSQQRAQFRGRGKEATVEWQAEYSFYVYMGVTYPNGTSTPPKPWAESAFKVIDDNGDIQDAFDEALK